MAQIARNLTDAVDGFFTGKRYLALGQPLERRGRFFRGGCCASRPGKNNGTIILARSDRF